MIRLDGLESRLRILRDEKAITETLYRYSRSIDYGLDKEWLDYFTDRRFEIMFLVAMDGRLPGEAGPPMVRIEGGSAESQSLTAPEAWANQRL